MPRTRIKQSNLLLKVSIHGGHSTYRIFFVATSDRFLAGVRASVESCVWIFRQYGNSGLRDFEEGNVPPGGSELGTW
jgi:hypothetical protein